MDIQACMDEIANEADEFLQPDGTRSEAREDIRDHVTMRHPELSPRDRTKVIDGVLRILEKEDFFIEVESSTNWPGANDVDVDAE